MALALGGAGLIAIKAGPWLRVSGLPVIAEFDASPDARLSICAKTCVRFTRKDGSTWLAELPPLQRYDLVVQSESAATLRSLKIIQTNGGASVLSISPNANVFPALPIGTVAIANRDFDTAFVFLLSVAFLGLIVLSVFAFMKLPPQVTLTKTRRSYWIAWGALSLVGMALIASIPVQFSGDTPVYLQHALSLLNSGDYTFPGADPWNATVRPPGYPAFLALVFLFTRDLSTIVLIQYAIHAISIGLLGSILGVQSQVCRVLFLAFGLLGPPHIVLNRAILSDGLCASLLVLAFYFFLRFKLERRGLIFYGLCVSAAAMVRPAAAIAIVISLPDILALYRTRQKALALSMGVVVALAPMAAWSVRNYVMYGYFGISSYGPLVRLAGLIETGIFNASSNDKIYDFYVRGRSSVQYQQFHSQMSEVVSQIYQPPPGRAYINKLNGGLKDIIDRSLKSTPLELRIAGFCRALSWGLFFPQGQTYGGYSHREYEGIAGFYSHEDELRPQSIRDLPIVYTPKKPNILTKAYAELAQSYAALYPYLVITAFVAAIVLLFAGNLVAALPALFHFFNVAVHAYLGVPLGRYIQPIDTLLMFSVVVAAVHLRRISLLKWELWTHLTDARANRRGRRTSRWT